MKPRAHGGNLYTKDEYKDFAVSFRIPAYTGSQITIRYPYPMEGDAAYVGMEWQILDNEVLSTKTKVYQYHGSVYGIIPAKRGFHKPMGEWNYLGGCSKGNRITVTLNGTVILDGDIKEATKNGTPDGKQHPGLFNEKGHIGFPWSWFSKVQKHPYQRIEEIKLCFYSELKGVQQV